MKKPKFRPKGGMSHRVNAAPFATWYCTGGPKGFHFPAGHGVHGEMVFSPLACLGRIDMRAQAEVPSAHRADTRMLQALGLTDELEIENGLFSS